MKIEQIKKGYIDSLMVEITRECNFSCSHCLRGPAQNKDLDLFQFRQFIYDNEIEFISRLTITGGEPLMKPKLLEKFVIELNMSGVTVESCYIATNGSYFNYKSLDALSSLQRSLESFLTVEVSNSIYHQEEREKLNLSPILVPSTEEVLNDVYENLVIDFGEDSFETESIYYNISSMLNDDDFNIHEDTRTYDSLISEGRATKIGAYEEPRDTEDMVYFSVKGEVVLNKCDISFKNIRKSNILKAA